MRIIIIDNRSLINLQTPELNKIYVSKSLSSSKIVYLPMWQAYWNLQFVVKWCKSWSVHFNVTKSKQLTIDNLRDHFLTSVSMADANVQENDSFTPSQANIIWKYCIESIVISAVKLVLCFMRDMFSLSIIYSTLCMTTHCPCLEYYCRTYDLKLRQFL